MTDNPDTSLRRLLSDARAAAPSEREMGTFFERVARTYLLDDPMQAGQHEAVLPWADWAAAQGLDATDHGIDLVARLAGGAGYAAIQCKYRDPDRTVGKADLDSFLAASAKAPFTRRIVIDSTAGDWSKPARTTARNQAIPVLRIGLRDLEASPLIWPSLREDGGVKIRPAKKPRPHQTEALAAVRAGLTEADRGKLIMACGTGKTFTALKIAEDLAGRGGRVLFLVPSLALMAQTVREWTADSALPLRSFAVCSDSQVGKRRVGKTDVAEIDILDLAFPASTDAAKLAQGIDRPAPDKMADKMTVVFATYQSIQVVADAQKHHGHPEFDLIVCDEAHRTTGATLAGDDESNFVKVHDNDTIRGAKRLYPCSTMRRHLSNLVQTGFVVRRDSPNGKRYARRYGDEKIAFGFDLSPLVRRFQEVCEATEAVRAADERYKRLRATVSLMRRDLAGLAEYGRSLRPDQGVWDQFFDLAALTARDLRRKLDMEDLRWIEAALGSALDRARSLIDCSEAEDMSTNDAISEQHLQNSNKDSYVLEPRLEKARGEDVALKVAKVTESSVLNEDDGSPISASDDHLMPNIPLGLVLASCQEFKAYSEQPVRHWHDLVRVADIVRPMMGISLSAWDEAKRFMGPEEASVVVVAMLERFADIRSPGGYLRTLSSKAAIGEFSCGPMIMALMRRDAA